MNEAPELVLAGGDPIWLQIAVQIRRLILSGILAPGEALPTVRAVAVGLAITPRIVERAYDYLEGTGLVSGVEGSGHRVAGRSSDPVNADLKHLCEDFLRRAARHGHSVAAVLHALEASFAEEVRHEQAG